ncbi:MAG: class I SAM-dependent methyltransferase [Vicinamibacterales bacterium]
MNPERAARIAALPFDFAAQAKMPVQACNLCGGDRFVVITHRDRYGYPAPASACADCGLVFLNPMMTAEAYGRFYNGTYRPLVSAYHGRLIDAKSIQGEQLAYARERADLLAPFVEGAGYASLLDIGGSTGVVAHHLSERFRLEATVIDPAPLEVEEARALGLETITGLVEDYQPDGRRFDVVGLFQTVDHLLDIERTLRVVRSLIYPLGLLFVDIVDFRAAYLRNWSVEEAVKVDHPYYLTEDTMIAFLRRAGFEPLRADYAADHLHISYVCRPVQSGSDVLPARDGVRALLNEIRYVQNARAR